MFGINISVWIVVAGMVLGTELLFSFIAQMFRKADRTKRSSSTASAAPA